MFAPHPFLYRPDRSVGAQGSAPWRPQPFGLVRSVGIPFFRLGPKRQHTFHPVLTGGYVGIPS